VFFDDILTRQHEDWIFNLLIAMGVAAILQATLAYLRAWCLTRWQGSMTVGGSSKFMWHVLHLPIEFFQQRYAGEVASRAQFTESVASILTGQAATALLDVVVAMFYLGLLFQYDVSLTLIGCFFSLINVLILHSMMRWLKEQQMKLMQDAGKLYGVSVAGIQTIETLKANGNESDFFTKWAGYQSKILISTQNIELTQQIFMLAPVLLSGLNTAMIMAVGGFKIMDGLMTAGIFIAFQTLMGKFQEPVNKLISLVQSLQTTETQIHRLDDVLRYPQDPGLEVEELSAAIGMEKLTGRVELQNITFGYSRLEAPLLENFSLTIEPGRRVALVGGSGSGKSTVAKLLTGLYQPWEGEILFDGIPRKQIPREVLVHSMAGVDQEIFLFSGTVAENISLFDPTVPRFDIVRAAKDADIHNDIAFLQGGYDAIVEEGGRNFSGGQRQRLEIARALAGNPSILVLDEATSALDPLTEQRVADNITRRGCSCLVIAHRLSTIRDCDEIIVLQQGNVAQRGPHERMMNEPGPYRQLLEPHMAGGEV
jgi:NHLM bacteriocin system ABC transporter peptidase/ATP-binding protein